MTENLRKEALSKSFVRVVAAHAGIEVTQPERDLGVDLNLEQLQRYEEPNGATRLTTTGLVVGVQVKATTLSGVRMDDDHLSYDLDVKCFNDIVRREAGPSPLVLALFVLPDDSNEWLALEESAVTLRRCGYLWRGNGTGALSENAYTQRIRVPLESRITVSTLHELFSDLAS